MKFIPALFIAASAIIASAASTSLQFVPLSDVGGSAILAQGVLPLSAGSVAVYGGEKLAPCIADVVVIGGEICSQSQVPLLSVVNASGVQTASLAAYRTSAGTPAASGLGSGNSTIVSTAVDASGNIWITGETDSDDFPLVHALFTQKTDYQQTGFVAKLDPNLNILFSSLLGGQTVPSVYLSTPAAIALDSAGNAYIAGTTDDPSFPVTGPAFGPAMPPDVNYAFRKDRLRRLKASLQPPSRRHRIWRIYERVSHCRRRSGERDGRGADLQH